MTFDLWIWKTYNGFEATADSSKGGAGPVFFSTPLVARDRQSLHGAVQEPSVGKAQGLGGRLFEVVFRGEIREKYHLCRRLAGDTYGTLRLRLNLHDPELWRWPWELLYENGFLALSPGISLVRRCSVLRPVSGAGLSLRSRVVIVAAPVANQSDINAIERVMKRGFDLRVLVSPNLGEFQAMLARRIKILHFLGPMEFGGGDSAYALIGLFERLGSPSLIVLNGQEVGQPSQRSVSDLAARIARAGAPAVLAMCLREECAGSFIQVFYESLSRGQTLERAVWLARQHLRMHNQGELWSNPTLYLQKEWRRGMSFWFNRVLAAISRQGSGEDGGDLPH